MNKITEFLNTAARHYYNGTPIITDAQFDALAESVGYGSVGALQHGNTQKHYFPMYSLQKFYADVRDATPLAGYAGDVVMSPKESKTAVICVKFSFKGDYLVVSYDNEHRDGNEGQAQNLSKFN